MPDKNYGVLTEQGYVAGNGLGFNPIDESDLNKNNQKEKDESSDKK